MADKSDLWKRRIGAFWLRDGKNGKYLSGTLDAAKLAGRKGTIHVNVLKNSTKTEAKHPDYEIFLQREEMEDGFLEQGWKAMDQKEGGQ